MAGKLSAEQVREFISDYPQENLLLDREEFTDGFIKLCMDLAVSEFNAISPRSNVEEGNFPSKSILLLGTLWQMYLGRATLMARNQLSYTDGGLQIPIEEKYTLYRDLADNFRGQFMEAAMKLKLAMNMESGWGEVRSDQATFPII